MAITFDDLPFGYARNLTIAEQREAVTHVLATLEKHRVTATVFVVGRTVTDTRSLVHTDRPEPVGDPVPTGGRLVRRIGPLCRSV